MSPPSAGQWPDLRAWVGQTSPHVQQSRVDAALILAIWGASLSTVLGVLTLVDRRRHRRIEVDVRCLRCCPPAEPSFVQMEVTNRSEQAISVVGWELTRSDGLRVAGSPYEGISEGPGLLEPRQIHGWQIRGASLAPLRDAGPLVASIRLSTGEVFRSARTFEL